MLEIPLPKGLVALIDEEDYSLVSHYNWFPLIKDNRFVYVHGSLPGSQKKIYMHRLIMNPPKGMQVDHINGNGFDNRRSNLRICTPLQNSWNRHKVLAKSEFRGVRRHDNGWESRVTDNNGTVSLGIFSNIRDAALAYDIAVLHLRGEFAKVNLPKATHPEWLIERVFLRLQRKMIRKRQERERQIVIVCEVCNKSFSRSEKQYIRNIKRGSIQCCSKSCRGFYSVQRRRKYE